MELDSGEVMAVAKPITFRIMVNSIECFGIKEDELCSHYIAILQVYLVPPVIQCNAKTHSFPSHSKYCHTPLCLCTIRLALSLLLLPFGLRLSFISIRTRFPFPFLRSFRTCVFRTRFSTIRQRFTITLVSSSRYIVI